LEKVEAILRSPDLYELAKAIPEQGGTGRPRSYPSFMFLVFDALLSVWRSARQVEAELSHPLIWRLMRQIVVERFPEDQAMHLPKHPIRRHHYTYMRDRYLTDPKILAALGKLHRELAAAQAREIGLMDPDGPGSITHPHLSRMVHADGKVLTPLFKGKPGDVRIDRETGEIRQVRVEHDAGLHYERDGEAAWGTKFVLVAARSDVGRIILDVERVPDAGAEARVAMECFSRLAPLLPGAQGVIYDTALRGVHHQVLLRELGLLSVNRVAAAQNHGGLRSGRKGTRVEKTVHVEDKEVTLPDGTVRIVKLFARAGAIGIVEFSETGEGRFEPLRRKRIHRNRAVSGSYAWYQDYVLPEAYGGGTVTVRLHGNLEDASRRFNRTENVRPIPPSDPDFPSLYARRNDAESLNRALDDTMFLGRAHSLGLARQQVEVLGWALLVNALTLARHRKVLTLAA
jgi:hypothetical protein